MIVEMISKYAYELYKIDWKRSHRITEEKEIDSIRRYYNMLEEDDADMDYTYEEYFEEFGYQGELYACYEEFLDNEYLDAEYVEGLLESKRLIALYHKDIKETEV